MPQIQYHLACFGQITVFFHEVLNLDLVINVLRSLIIIYFNFQQFSDIFANIETIKLIVDNSKPVHPVM